MVWSLFCAEDELKGDVIVSYGDIVYSGEILKSLLQSTSDIAVVIDKNWESYWSLRNDNPLDDAETLKLRNDGTISEIGQKPKSLSEIDGQYMGLIKLSSYGVEQLKHIFHSSVKKGSLLGKKIETAYMTDLLQAIIQSGERVTAVPTYSEWVEVDTVKDLKLEVTTERLDKIHHE
jgi:choline kinase